MTKEIYADAIGEITFAQGAVRIDLVSLSRKYKGEEDAPPDFEFRQRIIMSPEGFLRSFDMMQGLVGQLLEKGVIQKHQPDNGLPSDTKQTPDDEFSASINNN
uniref:DUF3467 domain-containing protein n=1 Tax=Candidatus Kentrum sp. DK TaxID=2126562 RepID=A0A450ST39_9GAMM|nr:MAG: hypothetical protein BECKDK2373C_GA0170839_105820 [Candidatus Kentron sp. DK]